jgi:hypothetical protein
MPFVNMKNIFINEKKNGRGIFFFLLVYSTEKAGLDALEGLS